MIDFSGATNQEILVEVLDQLNKQKHLMIGACLSGLVAAESVEFFFSKLVGGRAAIFAIGLTNLIEKRQYEIGEYTDLFALRLEQFFLVELRKWTVENAAKTMLKLLKKLLVCLIVAEILPFFC